MAGPALERPIPNREYMRLILLGAAIGIPAALVAAGFLAAVHELEHWLWEDLPELLGAASPPAYLVIGLPVVGAALVLLARTTLPGDGGHDPMGGIGGAPTPLSHAPSVALAALGTLAFGAVLGPEGPLIALGSAVGIAFAPLIKSGGREHQVLATAGSFSSVSALFGGPLVAGILLLEGSVGLGAASIPILLPGLVAAAIGYLLFVGLGDWGGLSAAPLAFPDLPEYGTSSLRDVALAAAVGVLTALVVDAVRGLASRVATLPGRGLPMPALLLGGGAAVGVLAWVAGLLGADPQDVLFSGQASVPDLVDEGSAAIVLVLVAAKAIGYAICLGCGYRGGPVFPAIFLGVGIATFAVIAFDVSPTLAVAIGAAAGTTAMTRLVFASLVFSLLLVGSAGVGTVPAAVIAAVAAWLTDHALRRLAEGRSAPAGAEALGDR